MFNHYHYWPERGAYSQQEALLEQARLARLLREAKPDRPGLAARLGAAVVAALRRVFARRRPAWNRTQEPDLAAGAAGRHQWQPR
jgi:hypothetical protein